MADTTIEDVSKAIEHEFPDEDPATIWAILDEYQYDRVHRPWILICILQLSEHDVDKLLYYTDVAIKDWRDVLPSAGHDQAP
jgi:hypothetical protein